MSETGIPVTEQDQSLVQRLRAGIHGRQATDLLEEAADRIEALERWLAGYRTSVESNDRCIQALELDNARLTIDGNQLRELCQLRYDRIEALERQVSDLLHGKRDPKEAMAGLESGKRVAALEAALREIEAAAPDNPGTTHHEHCGHPGCIARRALEAGTKAGTGSAVLTAEEKRVTLAALRFPCCLEGWPSGLRQRS